MASKEFVDIANQGSEGTKMPRAKWDFVTKIKQEVPPLPEQKAIASILGALDDKIELNRKMNETLEAMARAIFKSCFTYPFEGIKGMPSPDLAGHPLPVGEGRGEGELELVDSPLGKIPKGWMVGTIADISQLNRDVINPTDFPAETFQHYSIPAYDEGQMPTHDLGATVMSNKFLLPNNCILISKLNPRIPRIWFPKINKSYRSIASTEFLVLTPKAPYTSEFIYSLCTSSVFQDAFVSLVTGTSSSHQRVKPDDFLTIKTVCPSDIVLQKFAAKTEPLFARVQSNDEQSRTLATIRDTLLPKLLSGEIRVKEAEGFLEKA
jgi:type I restriction enzyme S subunit